MAVYSTLSPNFTPTRLTVLMDRPNVHLNLHLSPHLIVATTLTMVTSTITNGITTVLLLPPKHLHHQQEQHQLTHSSDSIVSNFFTQKMAEL